MDRLPITRFILAHKVRHSLARHYARELTAAPNGIGYLLYQRKSAIHHVHVSKCKQRVTIHSGVTKPNNQDITLIPCLEHLFSTLRRCSCP